MSFYHLTQTTRSPHLVLLIVQNTNHFMRLRLLFHNTISCFRYFLSIIHIAIFANTEQFLIRAFIVNHALYSYFSNIVLLYREVFVTAYSVLQEQESLKKLTRDILALK